MMVVIGMAIYAVLAAALFASEVRESIRSYRLAALFQSRYPRWAVGIRIFAVAWPFAVAVALMAIYRMIWL